MVEHLSMACNSCLMKKTSILDMVPKRPETMAGMVIVTCVQNRQLNALFPFLVLFGAHILSFYE